MLDFNMVKCLRFGALLVIIAGCSLVARGDVPTTAPALPKVQIALVGDSTVAKATGWGNGFIACMSDDATVINLARPGRSSMSFINEGWWEKCLERKPDYVLIQFGHNDQRKLPNLFTDPQTTYRKFMNQYVDDARAAGIKPILITSLSRRQWGPDGKIHSTLQPYVDVVEEIAKEKDVPLIDLHARSIELYEKLGKAEIETMSPRKPSTAPSDGDSGKAATVADPTHLNAKGSSVIGRIVAEELSKVDAVLARYVK